MSFERCKNIFHAMMRDIDNDDDISESSPRSSKRKKKEKTLEPRKRRKASQLSDLNLSTDNNDVFFPSFFYFFSL